MSCFLLFGGLALLLCLLLAGLTAVCVCVWCICVYLGPTVVHRLIRVQICRI